MLEQLQSIRVDRNSYSATLPATRRYPIRPEPHGPLKEHPPPEIGVGGRGGLGLKGC